MTLGALLRAPATKQIMVCQGLAGKPADVLGLTGLFVGLFV